MPKGFTLVETLVALVLFQLGMLALLAATGVAARDLATARRHGRALAAANNRVEQLRSFVCTVPEAGVASSSGGLTEYWRVEAHGPRRVISDSVEFLLSSGRRQSVVLRASLLCPP